MSDSTADLEASLATELIVDTTDPEVDRARAAIATRLLGAPLVQPKIGRFVVLERIGAGGMGIVYAAFDPQLDRKVALKLLFHRVAEAEQRVRMLREAQAMAKLAHPNVVNVYDVGEHAGRTFVAMELVRGTTLTRWLAAQPRSRPEIVDMCMQAGRGLAAAHREGIVHRDFKPDNILIGDDGRARVVDFGLARAAGDLVAGEATRDSDSRLVTAARRTGSLAGTPGYVAPEVLRGTAASASSDQFAFCVTVWEALSGKIPAPAMPPIVPPTIPGWIARILLRGLGEHTRYAQLSDLLRELADDPARRRTRLLLAGATALAIAGAFAIGASLQPTAASAASCDGAAQILEEAWPSAQHDAAFDAVSRTGPYGEVAASRLRTQLGTYAEDWAEAHGEACIAHQQGHLSDERFDRISACLDRGRTAIASFGRMLIDPQGKTIPAFVAAASMMPMPSACAESLDDKDALSAEAEALRLPLLEAGFFLHAYQIDHALAKAQGVVSMARAQDQPVVLAEALLIEGAIRIELGEREAAAERFREAEIVALRAGAQEIAVEAWGQHAWVAGTTTGGPLPEGRELIMAMADSRPTSMSTLSLYNNLGGAFLGLGDRKTGRAMYQRAYELAPAIPERRARLSEYGAMGALAEHVEDPVERARLFRDSIAGLESILGAEHPRTLWARQSAAVAIEEHAAAAVALRDLCDVLRRFHPQHHLREACVEQWAVAAELAGDEGSTAIALAEYMTLAQEHDATIARARAALASGDPKTTATLATEAIAAIPADAGWWDKVDQGEAEVLLGRARQLLGEAGADALMQQGLQRMRGDADRHTPPTTRRRIAYATRISEGTLPLPTRDGE